MERAPITPVKATAKPNDIGQIRNIDMKLTEPFKLNFQGDVNAIMIMVGPNGSGKTYVLKITWFMNMCALLYLNNKSANYIEGMQWLIDKVFENNNTTGSIKYYWENGDINLEFDNGKIIACEPNIPDEVEHAPVPIFMSKDMRTFDQIKLYLKFRNTMKMPEVIDISAIEQFRELSDTFRIYDIMYVEKLISYLHQDITPPAKYLDALKGFEITEDVSRIGYDKPGGMLYFLDKTGKRTNFHTLGAGHQSVMNMFLAQTLF